MAGGSSGRRRSGSKGQEKEAVVLTPHLGHPVLSTAIKIRKAGDGLSSALSVEPREMDHGEFVTVVLECKVGDIDYKPVKDTDGLQRIHDLETIRATFIDSDAVTAALDEQQRKIEAASGVLHLPLAEAGDDGGEDGEGDASGDDSGAEPDAAAGGE